MHVRCLSAFVCNSFLMRGCWIHHCVQEPRKLLEPAIGKSLSAQLDALYVAGPCPKPKPCAFLRHWAAQREPDVSGFSWLLANGAFG